MPNDPLNAQTISDDAMFAARAYIVENQRYPDPALPHPAPGLAAVLSRIKGRYLFPVRSTLAAAQSRAILPDTRAYVTLRVDPVLGKISGDLHADIQRKTWRLSWQSVSLFHIDAPVGVDAATWAASGWTLFGICDLAASGLTEPSGNTLALALRIASDDTIEACRIIETRPNGSISRDLTMTRTPNKTHDLAYRDLTPIHLADADLEADPAMNAITRQALGPNGNDIANDLLDAGSGLDLRSTDAELKIVQGDSPFDMITPYQWSDDPFTYAILFSSTPNTIYGTVLDLEKELYPLAKTRFGAVIFVRPIIDQVLEKMGSTDWQAHRDAIVDLLRRTYVHEIGHLLNLPHTWQRGRFALPPVPANPAAQSWMAYGSRFPLGDFMTTSRKKIANGSKPQEDALLKADALLSNEDALSDPGFTDAEKGWLWHAPFDHISPGGPYFTAREPEPVRLHEPAASSDLRLSIDLWDTHGTDPDTGAAILSRGAHHLFSWQPIFGEVVFNAPHNVAADSPFHFAFQSPMLSLLMREEYPAQPGRNIPLKVREIPVSHLPAGWRVRTDTGLASADLPQQFHTSALSPAATGLSHPDGVGIWDEYRRTTPFFDPFQFSTGFTESACTDFTLQAVLRPVGRAPIYSDPVRVQFRYLYKSFTAAEAAILSDPKLPTLLDTLAYLISHDVVNLERPSRHSTDVSEFRNAFQDLVAKISALTDNGAVSPSLMSYLRMVNWASATLSGRQNGITPPRPDERLLRLLRQFTLNDERALTILGRSYEMEF
ncbi:hypothetical protein [Jannaschia sp. CCS1]|uniref:hypothetical protein n=1 Tax=Jannaschia sp. (strain CCS1) TaxID=290400 RepID=UPI000053C96F|nr:hypothetical protein [Jannaschia sp. CCS1]ABD55176.1 hypothetical protein Jann_2259 [Jannaschia sp. CCS1]